MTNNNNDKTAGAQHGLTSGFDADTYSTTKENNGKCVSI